MKIGQTWGLVIALALVVVAGGARELNSQKKNPPQIPLTMRLAQENDLDAIMDLYTKMSVVDKKSLIVFPGDYQKIFLLRAIKKQQLFIAFSEADQQVVAVLKIFIITEQKVLDQILRNELRILPWGEKPLEPTLIEARFLHINSNNIANFSLGIDRTPTQRLAIPSADDWNVKKIASIYCGNCFTRDNYRGQRVASRLEEFAFSAIRKQVTTHMQQNSISQVCLLFGKVQAMYMHQGLIRSFMTFICNTPELIGNKPCISLFAWSFLATLPKFELDELGSLVETTTPIKEWKDYGCAFIYDVL